MGKRGEDNDWGAGEEKEKRTINGNLVVVGMGNERWKGRKRRRDNGVEVV